ncbi:MAG: ABC transporter ATP-binding protein [Micromonosporaceae bacterium]
MSTISLDGVTKIFADGTVAVDNLSLDVNPGELLVLLGPSGCGKSTVLRMIAGLESPTYGRVLLDGVDVADLHARDRQASMIFQDYALYPHMSVRQNLSFPLKIRRRPAEEIDELVTAMAEHLGIGELLDQRPQKLSGGQRQRVAMGRALIRRPSLFLLDEPLSNVDNMLRSRLRAEISDLVRSIGTTTVHVTHDQVEAMSMADRVAILREGALQDVGTPDEVYGQPATMYVAAFLGWPRMNLLPMYVHVHLESHVALYLDRRSDEQVLALDWSDPRVRTLERYHGEVIVVGARAEALAPTSPLGPDGSVPQLQGWVRFVEHLGHESIAYVDLGVKQVVVDAVEIGVDEQPLTDIAVRVAARSRLIPGEKVALGVDTDKLHFFEPSGPRIQFRRL